MVYTPPFFDNKEDKVTLIKDTLENLGTLDLNDTKKSIDPIFIVINSNLKLMEKLLSSKKLDSIRTLSTTIRVSAQTKKEFEELKLDGNSHDEQLKDLILKFKHLKTVNEKLSTIVNKSSMAKLELISKEHTRKILSILDLYTVTYSYDKLISLEKTDFDYNLKIEKIIFNGNKITDKTDLFKLLPLTYNHQLIQDFNEKQIKIMGDMLVYFLCLREVVYENKTKKTISKTLAVQPQYWRYYFRKEINESQEFKKQINLIIKRYEELIMQNG